tara:strand:- start:1665 stop:3101 length:1437 start_codon:yes stop_codon:yes gene_type:complete
MIKDICIVGGGTAGLISALILKNRFTHLNIKIVKSDKIGIIGVGEGSTEHWNTFINFCGLNYNEIIKETSATFKYGILFKDWTKQDYFHNVGEIFTVRYGQYLPIYAYSVINNLKPNDYTYMSGCEKNKVFFCERPTHQFHFNTFKLNEYLLKKCEQINIEIIEDEIDDVVLKKNKIDHLVSKNRKYHSDFFIDSTGFKRLLISKLGASWVSYKDYLPMNEAIAFPTQDTEEYPPYTLAKAMKAGWMWRIPTQGRWGNGYVFNNNYINANQAKEECEKYLKQKIKIGKNIKFEAGTLDKVWAGNCVAVGLSSSFVEPLEASSIGVTIQQIFMLMHHIINYNEENIKKYNDDYENIIENVRDFIVLHYLVNKKDSPFWKNLKLKIPNSLKNKLNIWKDRLPQRDDFRGSYNLFYEANWSIILKELGLVNKKSITKEFKMLNENLQKHTKKVTEENIDMLKTSSNWIDHKNFLETLARAR